MSITSKVTTSKDVARRAGVSQSAVSRTFTPGASVSKRMAERVIRAAEELDYRPNSLARGLITGRSRIIGLVVAYLDNQFYPVAIEKLSVALQEKGYHTMIFMAPSVEKSLDAIIGDILDYRVDGIVMASVAISGTLAARCESAGIPVVLFNRTQRGRTLSSVTSDNVAGGRKVAELLVACGHRRIAHVAGWSGSSTGQDREAGLRAGLADHDHYLFARVAGDYDREVAMQVTRSLFAQSEVPDALFVGNDHMAFGVLDVLRAELGLRVPADVAVVGYDDTPVARWAAYDLTTVRQQPALMIDATVDALLAKIERGRTTPIRVRIDGQLVQRGTTRAPILPFPDDAASAD